MSFVTVKFGSKFGPSPGFINVPVWVHITEDVVDHCARFSTSDTYRLLRLFGLWDFQCSRASLYRGLRRTNAAYSLMSSYMHEQIVSRLSYLDFPLWELGIAYLDQSPCSFPYGDTSLQKGENHLWCRLQIYAAVWAMGEVFSLYYFEDTRSLVFESFATLWDMF